ncbi:hypothetical protein EDD86DRAFT_216389 [Gorgonomyces haynaldii]|nr:hypothetical protein EDD86DRAFT_216389 [Gorgonomyces haynaldii]
MSEISRFHAGWMRAYFSSDPASATGKSQHGVYYDRNGRLHVPQDHIYYVPDCYNPGCYFVDCSCNDCGGGGDCGDGAILFIAVIAIVILVVAVALVFLYPPSMIVLWIVLLVGSFAEVIAGTSPYCEAVRTYDAVSAGFTCLYITFILWQIFIMQHRYQRQLPGTPGISIQVHELVRFFRVNKIVFILYALLSVLLMGFGLWMSFGCVGGYFKDNMCITNLECPWTTRTQYAWVVVHFFNLVGFSSMASRMDNKYHLLNNPPAYNTIVQSDRVEPIQPMSTRVSPAPPYTQKPHA